MTAIPRRHLLALALALAASIALAGLQGCDEGGTSLTAAAGCNETHASFQLAYGPAPIAPHAVDHLAMDLEVRGFTCKAHAGIKLYSIGQQGDQSPVNVVPPSPRPGAADP